jgi:hypothetical protein
MELNNENSFQISAIEMLPGNPEIVHHILIFVSQTTTGRQLDQEEEGPGYTCFGGPGTEDIRLLAGWAPGGRGLILPDNVGMTIPPMATLVVQVHYHYSGTGGSDRTRIGLHIADEERDEEMLLLPLVNQDFLIPAGATDFEVTQEVTLPPGISAKLYGVAPHMHLLGKTISVQATYLDSSERCLIDIPKWDFNWQGFYDYRYPLNLPPFTTLSLHCTFDNSELNPNNPWYPPRDVGWGEETTDEMALAFLGLVIPGFSLKAKNEVWEWPLSLERRTPVGSKRIVTGDQPRQPSCCKPGDAKKPWKKTVCAPRPNQP